MTRPNSSLLRFVAAAAAITLTTLAIAGRAEATAITASLAPGVAGNGMSVSPFTNVGDTNGNWFQQIYASSFFSGLGGNLSITSAAFRPKQGAFSTFIGNTISLSNVTVRLSTTTRNADTNFPNGLNGDLATNVGADVFTVYQGALLLTTDRLLGDSDVEDFDFRILFQNPFLYLPGSGNLLLDVIIPAGATVRALTASGGNANAFPQIDFYTDAFPSLDGIASAVDANLLDGLSVGSNSTTGVLTQFDVVPVPEPASLTLLGSGLLLGLARRRRARKTSKVLHDRSGTQGL